MIKRWLTPAVATVLALASLGAVVLLQHRADAYRGAEVSIEGLSAQAQLVGVTPLQLVDGLLPPPTVTTEMYSGESAVRNGLGALRRTEPTPTLARLAKVVPTSFATDNQILKLLTADPKLGTPTDLLQALRLGAAAEAAGASMTATFAQAKSDYRIRLNTAETQSIVGSALAILGLLVVFFVFYRRWWKARAALAHDALTDALTGLANRRALISDIGERLDSATLDRPLVLAVYDLDGFKAYNDTFGHLAGDALLARAAARLDAAVLGVGCAYRMGGDEFCTLQSVEPDQLAEMTERATEALRESGEAFEIGCSCGMVLIPAEAETADAALLLADHRMYQQKTTGRTSASRQSADVLLKVLSEKDGALGDHIGDVAVLAQATAQHLGLPESDVRRVRLAAELHDVGKSAIPDEILNKAAALDGAEWDLIRAHTMIGERIIRAAPSLADVAGLVRSSHERVDAGGYPDGLRGDAIPLGARIIAVCDAFDAMISPRPYREPVTVSEALNELRRCRGTQFDPLIVDAFCALIEARSADRAVGIAA